jgi:hypothetical protein
MVCKWLPMPNPATLPGFNTWLSPWPGKKKLSYVHQIIDSEIGDFRICNRFVVKEMLAGLAHSIAEMAVANWPPALAFDLLLCQQYRS